MKRRLFYILSVLLLLLKATVHANTSVDVGKEKKVLIINSYGERTTWSNNLVDSLKKKIHQDHPQWLLYSGHLKTESAIYSPAAALTLRSILWTYAERSQTHVDATDLKYATIFVQDDCPDAIVWVGEEGFLHYLTYALQLGRWREVPMVLCAVKDSVSAFGWFPEKGFHFEKKFPISNFRMIQKEVSVDYPNLAQFRKDPKLRTTLLRKEKEVTYNIEIPLYYSGSIVKMPVRQNLELIQKLLPDLKELIWVDDDTYRSMETRLEMEQLIGRILPNVKYTKMIHTRMNTDSIYDVMLQPAQHRAFLTYSWNIDGFYSKRTAREIDSLFTHASTVPLFTMTVRDFEKDNYWVGGYYLKLSRLVGTTQRMLERAMQDSNLNALPFDTLTEVGILLNQTALERYGLSSAANKLDLVDYIHIPLPFYQKYEKAILIFILILAMVACYLVFSRRRSRYNKRLKADNDRYKRLYNKLQVIYANSSIDFALYDESGNRLLRIVNGEPTLDGGYDHFSENIFESTCLSPSLKEQIRSKQTVNCEVAIDHAGRLCQTTFAASSVYQLIVKPVYESNHPHSCFMAIAMDLTPTIRERHEKEKFESLFHFASNYSQVGVAFYDADTAMGTATDSWCNNLNEAFLAGTHPTYQQVLEEDRDALLAFQHTIRSGNPHEPLCKEIQVNGKDGNTHWMRQHMYFIQESNRLVELSLDIDEQKKAELQLEEAKIKAEEANEETRQFLCSISHEVRTPLNAIVGFSDLLVNLEDNDDDSFSPVILRNTHLLEALITNILDLSALDAGKVPFNYSRIHIGDLFLEMEGYICSNLYDHSLRVIRELPLCEEDCFIATDLKYLRMLLLNLLSNAMKFTQAGSITLGCRREKHAFHFYIIDTGCGISPEDQKLIYNRFTKLDSYMQGTGLGLSLCKSIVKFLGGVIGVESEKGKGSTFWFVLPQGRG